MPDEVSLRDYVDLRIKNVEDKLDGQSKYMAQHFQLNELAIKKAEESMLTRLEGMNQFREQLNLERATYVTKEALIASMAERNSRLKTLETANAFSAGKLWMIMAIFAAIPTILAVIALFKK